MICPNCKCFVPTNFDYCQYCGCFLDTGSTKTVSIYDIPESFYVPENTYTVNNKKPRKESHSPDYLLYISIIILIIILLLCLIAVII